MIGPTLKQLRQSRNLKQQDVADKLKISQCHLSAIEQGKRAVSVELLERFSECYDTESVIETLKELFQ